MNYTLRLFLCALIPLVALIVGRSYAVYCKKRLSELEALAALLSQMEKGITVSLSTPRELFSSLKLPELYDFTERVRSGESLYDAASRVMPRLVISEDTKEKALEYFSEFGESYRDGELKRLELFRRELIADKRDEEERAETRIRLCYTLLFAAALSVVIMLL